MILKNRAWFCAQNHVSENPTGVDKGANKDNTG